MQGKSLQTSMSCVQLSLKALVNALKLGQEELASNFGMKMDISVLKLFFPPREMCRPHCCHPTQLISPKISMCDTNSFHQLHFCLTVSEKSI